MYLDVFDSFAPAPLLIQVFELHNPMGTFYARIEKFENNLKIMQGKEKSEVQLEEEDEGEEEEQPQAVPVPTPAEVVPPPAPAEVPAKKPSSKKRKQPAAAPIEPARSSGRARRATQQADE